MVQEGCIYAKYVQQNLSTMCTKIILILYLRQMLRSLRYLPVHCAKGAEFCVIRCTFLEFFRLTPSLLVIVRI